MVGFSLATDPTSKEVDGNPEDEVRANLFNCHMRAHTLA